MTMQRTLPVWIATALLTTAGCRLDMHDAPMYEPNEASSFFANGLSSRKPVEGTIARGELIEDPVLKSGQNEDGTFASVVPFEIDAADLDRGQQRFNIYCSPCHGQMGNGKGMIVQRGLKQPTSFHAQRLREMGVGYFYNVATNGYGVMYSYKSRVSMRDRWRIAAYIKALQRSQNATLSDVPLEKRTQLTGVKQ